MNSQMGLRYIAVVGSRDAPYDEVRAAFMELKLTAKHHVIVSGGARGADSHAKMLAENWGFHYVEVPAFWDRGKHAGFARNAIIIDLADAVVAVWDGHSRGTKDAIDHAERMGKKIHVRRFEHEIDPETQQVVKK